MSQSDGKAIRLTFITVSEGDPNPMVILHNPDLLTPAARDQVGRFGIRQSRTDSTLVGKLRGDKKAFTEVIQSYGYSIEPVPEA